MQQREREILNLNVIEVDGRWHQRRCNGWEKVDASGNVYQEKMVDPLRPTKSNNDKSRDFLFAARNDEDSSVTAHLLELVYMTTAGGFSESPSFRLQRTRENRRPKWCLSDERVLLPRASK